MTPNRGRYRRGNGNGGVQLRDDGGDAMDADNAVSLGVETPESLPSETIRGSPTNGPQQQHGSGSGSGSGSGPAHATAANGSGLPSSGLLPPFTGPRSSTPRPQSGYGFNPGQPSNIVLEGHPVARNGRQFSILGPRPDQNGPRPSLSGPPRTGFPINGPQQPPSGQQLRQAHLLVPGSMPNPYANGLQNGHPNLNQNGNANSEQPYGPWEIPAAVGRNVNGGNQTGYGPRYVPYANGPAAFANAENGAANGRGRGGGRGAQRGNGHGGGPAGRGRGLGRGIPQGHMSIDALLASDARRLMPVLHPARENGAFWFATDNAPRRVIVAAIRRHFDGPWFNISSVPNETIIQWWGEFIQSFYWDQAHGAEVYTNWHNITAARLRDMVSKAKRSPYKPDWISETIWDRMWEYWNSEEGQRRSRIAAANRLSDRDGLGRHAHTAGSRSYARLREIIREREGVEPSFWRLLRETHRKADGSYSDARVESIDQAMHVEMEAAIAASLATDAGNSEDPFGALTQIDEDSIYLKIVPPATNGRVFGLGANQPVRERGESSTMAATRINLENQVRTLQEQLAIVMEDMKRFKADRDASLSATPPTQGTMASANGPTRDNSDEMERTIDGAGLLYEVAREMADGIVGNAGQNGQVDGIEEADGAGLGFAED